MEAYASVYDQPEQIDEGITSVVNSPQDKTKGPGPTYKGPRIKMGPGEGGRFPKRKEPKGGPGIVGAFEKLKKNLTKEDVDVFDIVKGYLMTEHDLTEELALKVMLELEDEHRDAIIENIVRTPNINLPKTGTLPKRGNLTLGGLDLDKFGRQAAEKLGGEIGAYKGRNTGGNVLGIPEKIGRQRGTSVGRDAYEKLKGGKVGGAVQSVLDALK